MEYHFCEFCGSTENVEFRSDPFAKDVEDDPTMVWICNTCLEERANDI